MKNNKSKLEVIIREKANIKSRQWWLKCYKKIKEQLITYLPKQKSKLLDESNLSLLVTKDREIQKLNHIFRKKNKATDVLSFHLNKNHQTQQKYLGDIIISVETAKRQAYTKGVSIDKELTLLFIHAYLHLLGYDHMKINEEKIMFTLQDKVLDKCF